MLNPIPGHSPRSARHQYFRGFCSCKHIYNETFILPPSFKRPTILASGLSLGLTSIKIFLLPMTNQSQVSQRSSLCHCSHASPSANGCRIIPVKANYSAQSQKNHVRRKESSGTLTTAPPPQPKPMNAARVKSLLALGG